MAETTGAYTVVTHRDDERASGEAIQFFVSADERAAAKRNADAPRVIVQECDLFESFRASRNVQDDLSMSPSTPNQ